MALSAFVTAALTASAAMQNPCPVSAVVPAELDAWRRSVYAGDGRTMPPPPAEALAAYRTAYLEARKGDWPDVCHYRADNLRLRDLPRSQRDVVFMGDSITENWLYADPAIFPAGRINRGISGQTTQQMLLRFPQDVLALNPRLVHIMAGTNDIAGNTGPMTVAQTEDNFRAIAMLAKGAGIQVLLACVPPANGFPWRPGLETVTPIRAINGWAAANARAMGVTWIDYTPVLADASGAMKPGMAYDGVHPTEAGYDAMATVIEPFLKARKI